MNHQETLLKRFSDNFPNLSFKEMEAITGIQSTRMFRLYNGYEMKLKEYILLEQVMAKKSRTNIDQELLGLTQDLLRTLSLEERRSFHLYLQRELHKKEMKKEDKQIALRSCYV
jgi:hypothetical protein